MDPIIKRKVLSLISILLREVFLRHCTKAILPALYFFPTVIYSIITPPLLLKLQHITCPFTTSKFYLILNIFYLILNFYIKIKKLPCFHGSLCYKLFCIFFTSYVACMEVVVSLVAAETVIPLFIELLNYGRFV